MNKLEAIWQKLASQSGHFQRLSLRLLFETNPDRAQQCQVGYGDLLIDYSRELLDEKLIGLLLELAGAASLEDKKGQYFRGEKVNFTERRAALHMALRDGMGQTVSVDGYDVMPDIHQQRERFLSFAEAVRSGRVQSVTNESFTDILCLGIGGSVLAPVLLSQVLSPWHDGPRTHFVSNVDGTCLQLALDRLDPATTLVIVSSKTFTTLETLANAQIVKGWLDAALGGVHAARHLVAVSADIDRAKTVFDIEDSKCFRIWDWVGGRYSVWSAIGLPVAIAVGRRVFVEFLEGAKQMDLHFRHASLDRNLPVLLALIGIWRRNILGYPSVAVLPYDQRLARFPAYIQQLDMESNGKSRGEHGEVVRCATAPVVWGETGTDGQHSFFQWLHQGTDVVPVDFLVVLNPANPDHRDKQEPWIYHHQNLLLSNALAQANALAFGRTEDEVRKNMITQGYDDDDINRLVPHRIFSGNRPSTVICLEKLDARTLGCLLALYEHKAFVQGVIWGVNSYDQWGVELGKQLASDLMQIIENPETGAEIDGSTRSLVRHLHTVRAGSG